MTLRVRWLASAFLTLRPAAAGAEATDRAAPVTAAAARLRARLRLRAARNAAWAEHARALDAKSAARFSEALAADDALSAARLAHVQDLAELRGLQQNRLVTAAALERQDELLTGTHADLGALAAEIVASLVDDIGLNHTASASGWIEHIETWWRQRSETLLAWDGLVETQSDLAAARQDLESELAVLAEAMRLAGFENVDNLSPTALMQAAENALTEGSTQRATRTQAEKALHEREGDLIIRKRALVAAESDAEDWQQRWMAALEKTWLTDSGVGAVRELLRVLGELPAALGQRQARARQIDTMRRDQQQFRRDLGAILDQLDAPVDEDRMLETARQLMRRADLGEQDRRLRSQKVAERDRLDAILRGLKQELAVHAAQRQEMTAFFSVETLPQVSAALARSAERTRLQQQSGALGRQLVAELRVDTVERALDQLAALDLHATEQEAAETERRQEAAERRAKKPKTASWRHSLLFGKR